MTTRRSPGELAAAWAALAVRVSSIEVTRRDVPLADYPGGPRPSSVVCISGAGHTGFGENVAFTREEQDVFANRASALLTGGATASSLASDAAPVGWWMERIGSAGQTAWSVYDRAALEAALMDLALRQAGLSLGALAGGGEGARLRHVVSFAACANPQDRVQGLRAAGYVGELKIDVDPSWDLFTQGELAREAGIAILDFKGRPTAGTAGTAGRAGQLAALFPGTIFEDPPPEITHARISRDIGINDAAAARAAALRGEAVNLKAPRMGGPFEVLRALQLILSSAAATRPAYFGGMFEVGVGRAQARQLAALYCGDAPNDLALNIGTEGQEPREAQREEPRDARLAAGHAGPLVSSAFIRLDELGFGAL